MLYVYIDILTLANTEVGFSHACLHKMCFPHLHYTKVIILCQSNIYCNFFFSEAVKDVPSDNVALPAISLFAGSNVDKKEAENRNNALQLMGSIFITSLQLGQKRRITEPMSAHLSHFCSTLQGKLCASSSRGMSPAMVQSFKQSSCTAS